MLKKCQDCPFVIQLRETFTDRDSICFIFDYQPGQDIYWVINNQEHLQLSQKNEMDRWWVKFYAVEVLLALEHLHEKKIIYRDLKPENCVIDKAGHIQLIDFGFAKQLHSNNNFRTFTNCGTIGYTAPEILRGQEEGYSFSIDIWSYGIFLCEMAQGSLPFENPENPVSV